MQQWEQKRAEEVGSGKIFHRLAPPTDVDYINHLWSWARQADQVGGQEIQSSSNGSSLSISKTPPYWGAYHRWMRINVPRFKKAFAEKGENRHRITTLEELEFHYGDEQAANEQ